LTIDPTERDRIAIKEQQDKITELSKRDNEIQELANKVEELEQNKHYQQAVLGQHLEELLEKYGEKDLQQILQGLVAIGSRKKHENMKKLGEYIDNPPMKDMQ